MAVQTYPTARHEARAKIEQAVLEEYRQRTPRSRARHDEASRVMPGGDTRTVAFHAPYPLAIADGTGARMWDADGNEYVDLLNNYTALIHGHAFQPVIEAVTARLPHGTAFPAPNEYQTRLAESLCDRVRSVDLVRFCNSGTEAVMNAVRAARAFTGRDLIVKIEGGYHGTYDDVEVSVHPDPDLDAAGPDDAPLGVLDTTGVPANTTENVAVIPLNNVEAAERLFAARGDDVAAVLIEPVMGSAGVIPASVDFLEALRALTIEHGGLLIFDEVMSFRLGVGGRQEQVRVRPDLTTFAKIIGGGFPVGAFGGRAAVMEQFDPRRPAPLWQSGTFNGNLVTMVAGVAAMEAFDGAAVERTNRLGERLRDGLASVLIRRNVRATVSGSGSMVGVHLGVDRVTTYRDAARGDRALGRLLHMSLLLDGVFCAPRLMWCTSTAMDDALIDTVIDRFEQSVRRIQPAFSPA